MGVYDSYEPFKTNLELLKINDDIIEATDNLNAPYYMIEGATSETCDQYNELSDEEKRDFGFAGFNINFNLSTSQNVSIESLLECHSRDDQVFFTIKTADYQVYLDIINL